MLPIAASPTDVLFGDIASKTRLVAGSVVGAWALSCRVGMDAGGLQGGPRRKRGCYTLTTMREAGRPSHEIFRSVDVGVSAVDDAQGTS